VLAIKGKSFAWALLTPAAMLVNRAAKWIRTWDQRDIQPGDEAIGLRQPTFIALVNDIHVFQYVENPRIAALTVRASVPSAMRSVYSAFGSNPSLSVDSNVIVSNPGQAEPGFVLIPACAHPTQSRSLPSIRAFHGAGIRPD
jgi:hypothetical protein